MNYLTPNDDASCAASAVSYTDTAGASSTYPVGIQSVLVWATTDAYVKVGSDVTATSASLPIPAYTPVVIRVPPQQVAWKVSILRIATSGTAYVKPLG